MFKHLIKTTPIFLFVLLAGIYSNSVQAQTDRETLNQIEQYTIDGREDGINQITNVNQLKDVSPTDWSYEALRSLSERYGCVSGLPDGTYQGDRPITRNEFAAGLNSCFQQIERSINSSKETKNPNSIVQDFLYAESVEVFLSGNKNKDSFIKAFPYGITEIITLEGAANELEGKIMSLEDKQFSPTTKLTGETVFSVSDTFNGF